MTKLPTNNAKQSPQTPPEEVDNSLILSETPPEEVEEPEEKEESEAIGKYATEYFQRNGIPYCKKCGDQYHNNSDGSPVCPENFSAKICPRL
jgi:hypothetical protein